MLRTAAFNTPRVINQAKFLSEQGYQVAIAYWERGVVTEENETIARNIKEQFNINSIAIKTKEAKYGKGISNIIQRLNYFRKVIKYIKRNNYDAIHAVDFDSAFPSYVAVRKNKKVHLIYDVADFIQTFDNNLPKFIRSLISYLDKVIFKRAKAIVLPDKNRFEFVPRKFQDKVVIVNNAPLFNKELLSEPNLDIKENNRIKLAYYGGFSEERGIQFLLDCADKCFNVDIHFAGWGQKLDAIIEKSKICSNVFYHGKLSNQETLNFVNKMDVIYICYDSKFEHNRVASPNKLFEAFYLGKPLIVANNTSIDVLVRDEGIGYICDYNFESVCKTINSLKIEDLESKGAKSLLLTEELGYKVAQKNLDRLYRSIM